MSESVLAAAAIDYRELRDHIWDAAVALHGRESAAVDAALDKLMAQVPEGERYRLRDAVDNTIYTYLNHVVDHAIELALVSVHRQRALADRCSEASHDE